MAFLKTSFLDESGSRKVDNELWRTTNADILVTLYPTCTVLANCESSNPKHSHPAVKKTTHESTHPDTLPTFFTPAQTLLSTVRPTHITRFNCVRKSRIIVHRKLRPSFDEFLRYICEIWTVCLKRHRRLAL
jgi:hypothetical protein